MEAYQQLIQLLKNIKRRVEETKDEAFKTVVTHGASQESKEQRKWEDVRRLHEGLPF